MLFVFWTDGLERQGGNGSAGQVSEDMDPDLGEGHKFHDAQSYGNRWVERAAGKATYGEGASHDGHADGQPVERVVGRAFGRGDIEHDKSEGEGEEKLRHECHGNALDFHRGAALAAEKDGDQSSGYTRRDLSDPIRDYILRVASAAQEDGEGNSGIKMPARDVPGSEDHNHERRADGQGWDDSGRSRNDGAADGEHEEKSADEFCDVFVHCSWFGF